jgi:hypothetical protein
LGFAAAFAFLAGFARGDLAGFFDFGLGAVLVRVAMSLRAGKAARTLKKAGSDGKHGGAREAHNPYWFFDFPGLTR